MRRVQKSLSSFRPAPGDIVPYAAILPLESEDAKGYCERGETYVAMGDLHDFLGHPADAERAYAQALLDFDTAAALAPEDPRPFMDRAQLQGTRGRLAEALTDAARAIALAPELADARLLRGRIYQAAGQYEKALEDFEKTVEMAPRNSDAYTCSGDVNLALGSAEVAEAAYTRAIDLGAHAVAYLGRMLARGAQLKVPEALKDYASAVDLEPENPSIRSAGIELLLYAAGYYAVAREAGRAGEYFRVALAECNKLLALEGAPPGACRLRGQAYVGLGQKKKAQADFARAVDEDASLPDPYTLRGACSEQLGRFEEALEDYDRAVKLAPGDPLRYRNRAAAHLRLGHYEPAEADFSRALEIDPRAVACYLGRAQARRELGQFDGAYADCAAVLALDPRNQEAVVQRAETTTRQAEARAAEGEQVLARELYRRVLADYALLAEWSPANPAGYLGRGRAHLALGEYVEAAKDAKRAAKLSPKSAEPHLLLGQAYAAAGSYDKALRAFAAVLSLDPKNVSAHGMRGDLYAAEGDLAESKGQSEEARSSYKRALADYDAILEAAPDVTHAYASRARLYARLGRLDRSLADYSDALEQDPARADLHTERGLLYERRGDHRRALADYEAAVTLAPGPAAFRNRADAHFALGDYEQAVADYSEAIAAQSDFLEAYAGRARAKLALERQAEAFADMQQALAIDIGNGYCHHQMGDICTHLGNQAAADGDAERSRQMYEQAAYEYDRAAALLSSQPSVWMDLAHAHSRLKQTEAAIEAYSRALGLDPRLSSALSERGWLYLGEGRRREALLDFDAVVALEPTRIEGFWGRGDAYAGLRDFQRAISDYDAALKLSPDEPGVHASRYNAHTALAEDYKARGLAAEAHKTYTLALADAGELVRLSGDLPLAHRLRGLALKALIGFDQAVAAFDQALALAPGGGWLALLNRDRADACDQWASTIDHDSPDRARLLRDAIEACRRAMAAGGASAELQAAIGNAYGDLGLHDEAAAAFGRALDMEDGYAYAHMGLAAAHFHLGAYERARFSYEQAIERMDPSDANHPYAQVGLGMALEAIGCVEDAEQAYAEALHGEAGLDVADAYLRRAHAFAAFGEGRALQLADADYRAANEQAWDPGCQAECCNGIAWMYVDRLPVPDKLQEAAKWATEAVNLEQDPVTQAQYLDTRAWARYKLGEYDAACQDLEQAPAQSPYDVHIRYHLDRVREALARVAEAAGREQEHG